jgi:ubiquitin C-terminal hydrolase
MMLDQCNCPLFKGTLSSKIGTATMQEPFVSIDLPITNPSLVGCLHNFFEEQMVDFNNTTMPMQMHISSNPRVLCITLKRFNALGAKISTRIDIPMHYNQYKLIGTCNHMGGTQGGHYTATILKGNDWFLCNDGNCTKLAEFPMQDVYVMFYVS